MVNRFLTIGLVVFAAAGCGPDVKPRGTGASGRLTAAVKDPDLGYELINKLAPSQQPRFDWLHQPFDKVIHKGPVEPPADLWSKLQEEWKKLPFADVTDNRRYQYQARVITSAGTITLAFSDGYAPNHVRNFLILAQLGYFDGKTFEIDGKLALCGTPTGKPLFWMEPEIYTGFRGAAGVVAALNVEGKSPGTQFALLLDRVSPGQASSLSLFGGSMAASDTPVLTKIQESAKKGAAPVKIEKIEVARKSGPLFIDNEVALPELGPSGRPEPSPSPMAQQMLSGLEGVRGGQAPSAAKSAPAKTSDKAPPEEKPVAPAAGGKTDSKPSAPSAGKVNDNASKKN